MYDIVLVSVPFTIIQTPPLGIAVLKGAVASEGFSAKTIDLGMELFKACDNNQELFDSLQEYFIQPEFNENSDVRKNVEQFINHWAHTLANMPCRYIGISVFSYYSHLASYLLCKKINLINPEKKIVVGGPGVSVKILKNMHDNFNLTKLEQILNFGDVLKNRKLADFIAGDGEQALIDLLRGHASKSEFQVLDYRKNNYPFANFDDFDLFDYKGQLGRGISQIPIFSSKGCVRNCDFCDVNAVQNRFRFRAGKAIVEEMIYLADRYGIRDFNFLDSLVNGSLKNLLEWITPLAEYNQQNPDKKITWSGSWICRPIGQVKEHVYQLLAESGCQALSIGAESGSNDVLMNMDKKTNVEALYFEVEKFVRYDIKFSTLLLIGHWSETWEDFVKTCDMVMKLAQYARTGNYISASYGTGFVVIDDTPATMNTHINHLQAIDYQRWWTDLNPGLTAKEKYYRVMLLDQLVRRLKIPPHQDMLPILYWEIKNILPELSSFFSEKTKNLSSRPQQHAEFYYKNFEQFFNLLTERNYPAMQQVNNIIVELETVLSTDTDAMVEIVYNQQILYHAALPDGNQRLEFLNLDGNIKQSNFSIRFFNKTSQDTIIDHQGNILKDKYVKLKKFIVNNLDLLLDIEFFYNKLSYTVNQTKSSVTPGFWLNESKLSINFENPFIIWYCNNTDTYSQQTSQIIDQLTLSPKVLSAIPTDYKHKLIDLLDHFEY